MNPNTNAARTLSDRDLLNPDLASVPLTLHLISERSLAHLSDDDLLASTRRVVGRSNQLFAALLAHLGEVEARGLHRVRACSSLYTYCIYELRFSEDAAFRRVSAARLVKRFPAVLDSIERGELHLTGLLMLGPHLTQENHLEVLARAKHRTKKEIAKLVRLLDPLPDVPSRIEPLGAAPARSALGNPSWEQFAHSTNTVRELSPGDRPQDWMDRKGALEAEQDTAASPPARFAPEPIAAPAGSAAGGVAPARVASGSVAAGDSDGVSLDSAFAAACGASGSVASGGSEVSPDAPALGSATAPVGAVLLLTGPQRYQVQFTATEEYVGLVEQAKALLSHAAPHIELAELHLRAMRTLVAELSKRKYVAKATAPATREPIRGRAIPAAVKRAVFERDEGRCSYVEPRSGERCRETRHVEFHHHIAFAHGGQHTASNISLRCTAHNSLAAEGDFGRAFVVERKDSSRHESYERQCKQS